MNNKFTILILACVCLLTYSCAERSVPKEHYEGAERFKKYLHDIHDLDTIEDGFAVLLDNSFCGACNDKTINFLKSNAKGVRKTIVLSQGEEQIVKKLRTLPNSLLLFDKPIEKSSAMLEYGLSSPYAVVLMYRKNQIDNWGYIKVEDDESLSAMSRAMVQFSESLEQPL